MSSRRIREEWLFTDVSVFTATGNYTALPNEAGLFVKKATGAATTVTLPAVSGNDTRFYWVKDAKGDAATNNITVQGATSAIIDGASTYVISVNYGGALFSYNPTVAGWSVVADLTNSPTGSTTFNNVTLTGLLFESNATGITAGTTRTQAGATALTKEVNRVDTSTAPATGSTTGDGVALPASTAGLDVAVINNTANIITVYPLNGSGDQINGQGANVGVPIPPGDVAQFECAVAGDWRFEAGVGASGVLATQLSVNGVSAAGANQAAATQLVADFNRVTTATSLQGVILPVAKAGLDVLVLNHTGVSIIVYGNGSDSVDDIAGATGLQQMDSSVVLYTCYANGAWYTNGAATGYAKNPQSNVALETMQFADGISAAGAAQGTATQLSAAINTVSTVASGTGVNLPASSPGLQVTVINTGVNALLVYPAQGASDTINGVAAANGVALLPGTAATFNCTAAGAWTTMPASAKSAIYNTNTATSGTTLTAANITGAPGEVFLNMTGALGAGANAQLPTVAALVLALHSPTVGTSYTLRIINSSSGNFAWTVTTNTGWTLNGTMTINQNTWRDFVVTLTSLSVATIQTVGTGTFS